MASVAAAIDRAAHVNVDSSLYWNSHSELFEYIEKYGQEAREETGQDRSEEAEHRQESRGKQFASKLEAHHEWLLNTFAMFKGPSESSKSALNNPVIKLGSHMITIKEEMKAVALQVSAHLDLDQVQSYILVARFVGADRVGVALPPVDRAFLEKVSLFYYVERQCLLKCLRSLLTFQEARDSDISIYISIMRPEVQKLVAEKVEDKIVQILTKHVSSSRPKHVTSEFVDIWAEETGREQALLLDILFLLYYDPNLVRCSAARFKELVTLFKTHMFLSKGESSSRLAVTAEAEKIVRHVRHLAVLVLIDAIDLDSLLVAVSNGIPFSEKFHPFSEKELSEAHKLMEDLNPMSSEDHAFLLMAWAVLLCLFSSLSDVSCSSVPVSDNIRFMSLAYAGGAYQYVLNMLRTEPFQEPERHVTGYKSVIKTVMAGFFAAYDIANQADFEGFDMLVEILCDIFRREEELCSAFWASDSELDGPIRSFMFSIHKQFPCVIVPLLELLKSQCEGAWAAECVYDFLHRLTPMASMYELPSDSFDGQDGMSVRTPKDLTVPGAPGLLIPAGTFGQVLRSMDNFIVLVQWQCEHSSILVLLLRMVEIVKQGPGLQSDDAGIQELRVFLSLLDKLLEANHVLAQLLLDLDHSAVVEVTQSLGRVQDRLTGNMSVVKMLCLVVHELALHFPDVEMIAACLRILSSFVPCYPHMVLQEISKTSLLQPAMDVDGLPSSGEWALANSQIHNLLVSSEQTRGLYPLTLAALQFMQALVDRGLYSGAAGGLVLYMETEMLVKHATWRYLRRVERWQISAKVLQVLRSVIGAELTSEEGAQLKRMVTDSLLHDTLVLNALFQVLAVDTHGLQELQYNRTVGRAEIEAVEEAICALLNLLSQVVENVNASASIGKKDLPPMSPLEVAIFNRSLGSEPMVSVIASYLQYSHCMSLPEATAKLLSNLCSAAWRARPHPVTLASYLSSSGQVLQLQRALAGLLEEETALTLPTLFSAVINLLVSATEWQPTLVELLLFPPEAPSSSTASGTGRPTSDSDLAASTGSTSLSAFENGLDALWAIVCSSDKLLKSNPWVLSEVLFLLASMWQSGSVLYRLIDAVRTKSSFWQSISACLFSQSSGDVLLRAMSEGPAPLSSSDNKVAAAIGSITMELDSHHVINASLKKQELHFLAYRLQCEASVLQLVSFDIFLHQHMADASAMSIEKGTGKSLLLEDGQGGGLASGKETSIKAALQGLQVILEWSKHSSLSPATMMRRYALSLYVKEAQQRAQEEARALVVGIMAQWMTGYERGLHMELSRRVMDISRKISELPLMKELVGQYSSRMYSKRGVTAEALVMSDLYHHLWGQLEGGREVPLGPFRELSDLLKDSYTLLKNVSSTKASAQGPSPRRHPLYGDRYCYDVEVISSWLGYEWWIEVPQQVVPGTVVEGTLRSMRRANAVLSASNAQLSALNAWEAVMAVAMFDCRGEIRYNLGQDAGSWKLKDIADSILELCKALEHSFRAIGSAADCHCYLHSITAAQARLLVVFLRLWCPVARRTEHGSSGSLALTIVQPNDSRVKNAKGKGAMRTDERGNVDAAEVALCAQVVKTVVLGLKVHAASQGSFRREEKESVIPLLSSFLLVLEHLRSSMGESDNGENKGLHENAMDCGMDATDAYAEVILNGLSALPLLCLSAFNMDYSSLSIAIINLLCRNYLAPPTWLPIVSRHLAFPDLVSRLLMGSPRQFDESVLGFFLSMTQMEEGARLLHDGQIIKKLSKFVQAMERKQWLTPESIEGPFSGIRPEAEREGEWQLTISIVASVLDTLEGKEESVDVVEHALDFVGTHSNLLLSAFHVVPAATISKGREALGSTSSRGGHAVSAGFEPWVCTSMASLGRTERVVLLLCGMARHIARWTHVLPGSQDAFREGCMRVLAYIAREGAGRLGKGAGAGAPGLSCTPNSREERMATKRDALVGSKKGWFFICEVGATRVSASSSSSARALKAPVSSSAPPNPSVKRGETLSVSRTQSFTGPSSSAIVIRNSTTDDMSSEKVGNRRTNSSKPSQYSENLAVHVYRLTLLILKFLCMLAQEPLSAMEDRGHYDYSLFPELPSPEVLHALQDQCMAILLEIGETESGGIVNTYLQRVCLMLASIIERTLYLEACAVKAYGIVPSPMRTHTFEKYYSQLRPLLQANRFLDATLTSLRSVVPMVHTGVM